MRRSNSRRAAPSRQPLKFRFLRTETAGREFNPVFRGTQCLPDGKRKLRSQALEEHLLPGLSQTRTFAE